MRECIEYHNLHPNGSQIASARWEGGVLDDAYRVSPLESDAEWSGRRSSGGVKLLGGEPVRRPVQRALRTALSGSMERVSRLRPSKAPNPGACAEAPPPPPCQSPEPWSRGRSARAW